MKANKINDVVLIILDRNNMDIDACVEAAMTTFNKAQSELTIMGIEKARLIEMFEVFQVTDEDSVVLKFYCPKGLEFELKEVIMKHWYKTIQPKGNSGEKGCYIATACYGDFDAPEVLVFRQFKDEVLSKNLFGQILTKYYYKISPFIADKLKNHQILNRFIKVFILDQFYKVLRKR